MTDITYLIGDATKPTGDGLKFVAHIVNNIGGWGSGFVLAVSARWGMPELMYRKWFSDDPKAMREGLGRIQIVPVEKDIMVVNLVGQEGIGFKDGIPPVRYEAIEKGLLKIQKTMENNDKKNPSLHLPRIGCGLAGATWPKIEAIIHKTIKYPVFVYTLPNEAEKYGMKNETQNTTS